MIPDFPPADAPSWHDDDPADLAAYDDLAGLDRGSDPAWDADAPGRAASAGPGTEPRSAATAPPPRDFGEIAVPTPAAVASRLKTAFGFEHLRPAQEPVVEAALASHDLLAVLPTGGGKSLCFQLPALLRPGLTLVISPLIALMQDQVRLLDAAGLPSGFLNSTQTADEARRTLARTHSGQLKLLYLAPERLLSENFLNETLPQLAADPGVSAVVVDEAHCLSEWGHDFRPEYRQLTRLKPVVPHASWWAFTATATPRVREDIVRALGLTDPVVSIAGFDRENLVYEVRPRGRDTYAEILARCRAEPEASGIVYCLSRGRTEELADKLAADGVTAVAYHAGLSAKARYQRQDDFIHDRAQVICATVAFGMGINKPDVRWVVHHDLPKTIEGYYQEAGRAGRDGEPAACVLYFSPGDIPAAEHFIRLKTHPGTGEPLVAEQRQARYLLRQMLDYTESTLCRHRLLVQHFGAPFTGLVPCGACDNCLSPRVAEDRTEAARMALSVVARLAQRNQRFGAAYVIDLLRGSKAEKVTSYGHDTLSVHGIGQAVAVDDWRWILRALVQQGFLAEAQDGFPVLTLTPTSRAVLKGEVAVSMAPPPKRPASAGRARKAAGAGGMAGPGAGASAETATPAEEALFERLRQLRRRLASEKAVPPYVVFPDASLRAMAALKPASLEDFARVPGVGAAKLKDYGEAFVEEIGRD